MCSVSDREGSYPSVFIPGAPSNEIAAKLAAGFMKKHIRTGDIPSTLLVKYSKVGFSFCRCCCRLQRLIDGQPEEEWKTKKVFHFCL